MKALNNQTILDIMLQEAGSIEVVVDFTNENNISVTDGLLPSVEYIAAMPVNTIPVIYKANKIIPATLDTSLLDGIGYERIEYEFTVR